MEKDDAKGNITTSAEHIAQYNRKHTKVKVVMAIEMADNKP